MSFRTGKMGVNEGMALIFIITFPRLFLTTPVFYLDNSAGLAWLSALFSGLSALIILFVLLQLCKTYSGDLFSVCQQLLGKPLTWVIFCYYIFLFSANCALLLRQYAENTLITALPEAEFMVITFAYILTIAISVYLGIEAITRTTSLIMPFGIASILIVLVLLVPFYKPLNLAPWLGNGIPAMIETGLMNSGLNLGILSIVILLPSFQNQATAKSAAILGLGGSIILESLSILIFTMVFDITVGREKILPFFEMARLVYISRYLQRIEALFIVAWVMAGVLGIAASFYMALYLITRLFKLPALRPLIPLFAIIIAELSMLPSDVVSVIRIDENFITSYFLLGLYGIPGLLAFVSILRKKKVTACK